MQVTAIIPTFNRADMLAETIDAVLAQSCPPAEILVVNDGSEDHTDAILAAFADKIRILSKPNSGKADSLNKAIAQCAGSHIWIVDDDDLPRPDGLQILVSLLQEMPEAEIAYGRHIRFSVDPDTQVQNYMDTGYWDSRPVDWFLIATLEDFFAHQPGMLVSRALYERAGLFNVDMVASEDYDMLIRLAYHGKAVATDRIIFDQRVHSGIRGQKGHQFAATDRDRKWIEYDQRILKSVYQTLPLSAYLPDGLALNETTRRQALLQRGTVMMRKLLWPAALEDFSAAARLRDGHPLTRTERAILRRALLSKYGCESVLETGGAFHALCALRQRGGVSASIVRALARALIWHTRTRLAAGRLSAAIALFWTYLRLVILPVPRRHISEDHKQA